MRRLHPTTLAATAAFATLITGCVPQVAPPPRVVAAVAAAPVPLPPPAPGRVQMPFSGDWRDWPVTPGNWVYRQDGRGSIALFGAQGVDAAFTIRCDRIARRVYISRSGAAPGNAPMTIRTTSTTRTLTTQPTGGTPAYMAAALTPTDSLLDAMAFSRGRFIVEQGTLPILVIPSWAEVPRVTEDCRQ